MWSSQLCHRTSAVCSRMVIFGPIWSHPPTPAKKPSPIPAVVRSEPMAGFDDFKPAVHQIEAKPFLQSGRLIAPGRCLLLGRFHHLKDKKSRYPFCVMHDYLCRSFPGLSLCYSKLWEGQASWSSPPLSYLSVFALHSC
jgi:hypothetical protein